MQRVRLIADRTLDRVRFSLDTRPYMDYQPLPWLGKPTARRAIGVESRWDAIRTEVAQMEVSTALDIGSNVGYFSIQLAQSGLTTIAVERIPRFYRPLLHAIDRLNITNIGVLVMDMAPASLKLLPQADITLFLSVWHHYVRDVGFENSLDTIRDVWKKSDTAMFFETGQAEMPASFRLPSMEPDPRSFLARVLEETCTGGRVEPLGQHAAFAPDDTTCSRELFIVRRV